MAKVIVLQHAECEGLGAIEAVLTRKNIEVRYIRSFAGDRVPENLDDSSGLIVMGGPMSVYEQDRYPFLRSERQLIEKTVADNKPVLGVCLGSQLLAAALGAEVSAGPQKEIGWYRVHLTDEAKQDPLWINLPDEFTAFHWHGDRFELPSGAVRLASSEITETQSFRYGSAYGFLFHLEVTEPLINGMVTTFEEELRDAGKTPKEISQGTSRHLTGLQAIGDHVFTTWTESLGAFLQKK